MIFTETWLEPSILTSEIGLTGYKIFRRDRKHTYLAAQRAGGVLIAVHNRITVLATTYHLIWKHCF